MTEMAISILVGFVAAGFVWYTWGLFENVLALLGFKGKTTEGSGETRPDDLGL
jgi:hypothetical protein